MPSWVHLSYDFGVSLFQLKDSALCSHLALVRYSLTIYHLASSSLSGRSVSSTPLELQLSTACREQSQTPYLLNRLSQLKWVLCCPWIYLGSFPLHDSRLFYFSIINLGLLSLCIWNSKFIFCEFLLAHFYFSLLLLNYYIIYNWQLIMVYFRVSLTLQRAPYQLHSCLSLNVVIFPILGSDS